jgi:hypothetical protein
MRRRTSLIPLTYEGLLAKMECGESFTVLRLSHVFDASTEVIRRTLDFGVQAGTLRSGLEPRDSRSSRMKYWMPPVVSAAVAGPRYRPSFYGTVFTYDLMTHQRLCMATRR